jgi:two-component system, cell cycle sensor histidine kinase and response regulator CckA
LVDQVLMNLTVNACDAMPQGGKLTIETRNVDVDEAFAVSRPGLMQGPYVMLSAIDTGHGMDAKIQARIFEPFFNVENRLALRPRTGRVPLPFPRPTTHLHHEIS